MLFADPPSSIIPEAQNTFPDNESNSLAVELFGEAQAPPASSTWNSIVLNSIQTGSRNGLGEDTRTKLLTKYNVKENLPTLAPPKLNRELVSALTPSVIKRDEYQTLLQAQVGACLNALGSSMSIFLKPDVSQNANEEIKSALKLFSDGIHLLSDHYYRLSLNRRAFTKPSLNLIGKTAADSAPVDDFLFGENFAESLKAAQTCEKSGREMSKAAVQVGRKTQQPVRQTPQQRSQPYSAKPSYSGNRKAPARPSSARQTGAHYYKSRRYRSHSRTRRHH